MGNKQSSTAAATAHHTSYNNSNEDAATRRKRSNTQASHHSHNLDTKPIQEPTRSKAIPAPAQVIMYVCCFSLSL